MLTQILIQQESQVQVVKTHDNSDIKEATQNHSEGKYIWGRLWCIMHRLSVTQIQQLNTIMKVTQAGTTNHDMSAAA